MTAQLDTAQAPPTRLELLAGFLKIGLLGFGGVGPVARHIIVHERGWLDDADYARTTGICQVLPGANTVNAAVIIGDRYGGALGALVSLVGLMGAPVVIAAGLALAYAAWGELPAVQSMLQAIAAAAAGLVLGTGVKLAWASPRRLATLVAIAGAVVGVALLLQPLVLVVAVVGPIAVAIGWWELKREK
jgi:chromate transporter